MEAMLAQARGVSPIEGKPTAYRRQKSNIKEMSVKDAYINHQNVVYNNENRKSFPVRFFITRRNAGKMNNTYSNNQ